MTYTFKGPDFIVLEHGQVIKGTNTYDTTTALSNETFVQLPSSATSTLSAFRSETAIGCGVIVAGATPNSQINTLIGNAWIYDYDGNLLHTLVPSVADVGQGFGRSVSVAHDRVIVGAYLYGEVYIYSLAGAEIGKISDTMPDSLTGNGNDWYEFGTGIDIGCGRMVIGAPDAGDEGAAYVTDLQGKLISKIQSQGYQDLTDANDFGEMVAIGCGRIVSIASPNLGQEHFSVFDMDGNLIRKVDMVNSGLGKMTIAIGNGMIVVGNTTEYSGKVRVHDLNGIELFQLTPLNTPADHGKFGWDVAIGCGRILASAFEDDSGAGAVYVFDLSGNQIQRLTATNSVADGNFGYTININDGKVVVTSATKPDGTASTEGIGLHIYDTPNIKFHQDLANGR